MLLILLIPKESETMQLNKNDWYYLGQWVSPTLCACLWDNWTNHNKFPFAAPDFSGKYLMLHGHSSVQKNDVVLLSKFIQQKEEDFAFLDQLQKWVDSIGQNAVAAVKNASGTPAQKLKIIYDAYKDIGNPWIFFLSMDDFLTKKVQELCIEFQCNEEEVLKQITPSRKPYAVQQLEEARLLHQILSSRGLSCETIEELQEQNPALGQKVKTHIEKFVFCGLHHFVGEPHSYAQFLAKKDIPPSQFSTPSKMELPKLLEWYVQLSSLAAFGRTHMAETSGILQYHATPTLLEVNELLGLAKGEYIWFSFQEIFAALQNPPLVSIPALSAPAIPARKKQLGVFSLGETEIIITGKELDDVLAQFLSSPSKNTFPLKGMVACKGIVRGKAKIVIIPDDIQKVEVGDILVAPETSPDFFPAMARSGGIITNRGGVTSHAAIVSRELGKPCIVGVKDATTLLHDGEEIVLDAENGEVRLG